MKKQVRYGVPAMIFLALLQACGGGGGDETTTTTSDSGVSATAPGGPAAPGPAASAPSGSAPGADITCGLANFEADALRIVNQRRAAGASCGSRGSFASAAALARNTKLAAAAYGHSRDMADKNYFSHDSQDGRTMRDRIDAAGYAWSTIGENIAAGYGTVQVVVDEWMRSDGHCANLMNPRFTEFGLACARNEASVYKIYWTQNLGRP
jgi:uncharacterized protein YkwD